MATAGQVKPRGNLPPYISFKTLTGFLQKLKETTVPGRVDGSVLRSYAGSVARQLVLALKYLQLLDATGATTTRLKALVTAYGTPEWKEQLSNLIFEVYQPVIGKLDLDAGTHQQLVEAFRLSGTDGVVLERAITFFLTATKEAGSVVSPHFTDRPRRPRIVDKTRGKKKEPNDLRHEDGEEEPCSFIPPDEMARFTLPIPGKHNATIVFPVDLTGDDWEMISTMMKAYVLRREKASQ